MGSEEFAVPRPAPNTISPVAAPLPARSVDPAVPPPLLLKLKLKLPTFHWRAPRAYPTSNGDLTPSPGFCITCV